jgi:CxxC motif-containing protein (DUF1111 family)
VAHDPLIGVGQSPRYLHDGRAATLRAAIQAHGGEGEIVRNRFFNWMRRTNKRS